MDGFIFIKVLHKSFCDVYENIIILCVVYLVAIY